MLLLACVVVVMVVRVVIIGGIVVLVVIGLIVVFGCRRSSSCYCPCVVEVIVSRVCVVALYSDLHRYSESWCYV